MYTAARVATSVFFGLDVYKDHSCFILDPKTPTREFDWLVPVSGLLHMEMNIARAFTKLNWQVFVGKLSYELGFKTLKAQEYIRRGADHHKLWHMLEIS